ncbi:MAG TPA: MBL fold metallo-hydrolase [Rhizomicrobium sp.]|jgi:glyoxylase-like metal-dependent hydrolase (beta-lactamase superfamily II)|nr:MBL fold metallo-hydrolase [Rhizomicrobium sp.]
MSREDEVLESGNARGSARQDCRSRRHGRFFALCLAVAPLFAGTIAFAQYQVTQPQAVTFRVGNLSLVSLHDGKWNAPNDASKLGMEVGIEGVKALMTAAGAPTDQLPYSFSQLLVRLGRRTILIDTGHGPLVAGLLVSSLAAANVSPAEVTDILITHSHYDHIGGLVDKTGHSAFPNAKIHMSAAEWSFVRSGGVASTRNFEGRRYVLEPKPVAEVVKGQVITFAPGDTLFPGITSVALPGHTPGHVGYEISSRGQRLLVVGDMVHNSIISLARPEWTDGFDVEPKVGIETRVAMLKKLAASGDLVFAEHFPYPSIGQIKVQGDGFAWEPAKP